MEAGIRKIVFWIMTGIQYLVGYFWMFVTYPIDWALHELGVPAEPPLVVCKLYFLVTGLIDVVMDPHVLYLCITTCIYFELTLFTTKIIIAVFRMLFALFSNMFGLIKGAWDAIWG